MYGTLPRRHERFIAYSGWSLVRLRKLTSIESEMVGSSLPTLARKLEATFRPHHFLRGGHVQTLASFFLPRRFALPEPEDRLIEVEPGIPVLCRCHWQRERQSALTIVIVHGLEGSSESHYMLGIAEKGLAAGMNVVRMNQRTCGGTDSLAPTLYHSGRSTDV